MDKKIKDLKSVYEHINIPEKIDVIIDDAIMKGHMQMKLEQKKKKWFKGFGAAAVVLVLLTVIVNTMPAVADSIDNIPGVGKLVQVLRFDKGISSGGTIMDGSDVRFIAWQQDKNAEKLTVNFGNGNNSVQDLAPYYEINYTEYPCSMTFTLSGVRSISAEKDLEDLKESKYIADVYKLITLDDSMVRFTITFNNSMEYEVKEYKEPAQLVVTLKKNEAALTDQEVYSVRTASYPFGESIGILEEQLMEVKGKRILKDNNGTFFIEVGYFTAEQEAQTRLKELSRIYEQNLKLHIEKRSLNEIPEAINNQ